MLIDLFDNEQENPDDFVSFIVFEPASLRIPDNDLLLVGDKVTQLFSDVINSDSYNDSIQDKILMNRLRRIEMMIDLLKSNDGLILTKFLNNIWRRYSFFSNLGELFITQRDLKRFAPDFEFNTDALILDRYIESNDSDDSSDDSKESDNSDDSSDDSKESDENKSEEKEKK